MAGNNDPVGVFDSGVGGLTLLPELVKLCPGEDIVYFGDSLNCPYGNRTREDLLRLVKRILSFMLLKNVKLVAIACNTTSPLAPELSAGLPFPLIDIISPVAGAVASSELNEVGVLATEFTVSTGIYSRTVNKANPNLRVYEKGSRNLAALVDRGAPDEEVDEEITRELGALLKSHPVKDVILACTHYPVVLERFKALYPGVSWLDPTIWQAKAAASRLDAGGLKNPGVNGRLEIYTSGDPRGFGPVLSRLGIAPPDILERITLP